MAKLKTKKSDKSFVLKRDENGIITENGHLSQCEARTSGDNVSLYNRQGVLMTSARFPDITVEGQIYSNAIDCENAINLIVNFNSGGGSPSPTPTTSDDIENKSNITGITVTDALNTIDESAEIIASIKFTASEDLYDILNYVAIPVEEGQVSVLFCIGDSAGTVKIVLPEGQYTTSGIIEIPINSAVEISVRLLDGEYSWLYSEFLKK